MSRCQVDDWSLARSLALLAALFAIVFGSLVPYAALAAARSGHPLVICSADGPQTVSVDASGKRTDENKAAPGARCAACLLVVNADLPQPPVLLRGASPATRPASVFVAQVAYVLPPARAPPRPPSTAPPQT